MPLNISKDKLETLKATLEKLNDPQGLPVHLVVPKDGSLVRIPTPYAVVRSDQTLAPLFALVGQNSVSLA